MSPPSVLLPCVSEPLSWQFAESYSTFICCFGVNSISYCFTVLFLCSENISAGTHAGPAVLASQQGSRCHRAGFGFKKLILTHRWHKNDTESIQALFSPLLSLIWFLDQVLRLIRNVTSRDCHRPTSVIFSTCFCVSWEILWKELRQINQEYSTPHCHLFPWCVIPGGIKHNARRTQRVCTTADMLCMCWIRTAVQLFSQNRSWEGTSCIT